MSLSGTTPDPEIELLSHGEPLARDRIDVAALFADHHLGLVRLALLMVGDQATAEDVVQEAFTRTHAGRHRLRDPGRALTYIRSAVLNGSRSVLRRRAVAFRRPVPYEPPVWSAEHAALLGEERREVLVALRALPGRQREALTLRYYLDLSDLEIAETMGIGAGTARSTIARGLAALARKLGEES
ncbi:SigE family RNA polymerase sigma factor [Streptosporangium sp. NBC_01756]|uniref:SigE family RNA polymerase sigma factor n=1 Tax=Streptosporangium sp. NBC_01756 TaxID=2975950 RepID=UPI002DDB3CC3|nr:SigE family RNA polymerase sigma factor [Streptosporangium sp. NBC_01756]WSC90051.1 SigE family RNA polymerase sigma factor [Streptosporangium sp. NBC_01756]